MDENKGPGWCLWLCFPCSCVCVSISLRRWDGYAQVGELCSLTTQLGWGFVKREQQVAWAVSNVASRATWKAPAGHFYPFYFLASIIKTFKHTDIRKYTQRTIMNPSTHSACTLSLITPFVSTLPLVGMWTVPGFGYYG